MKYSVRFIGTDTVFEFFTQDDPYSYIETEMREFARSFDYEVDEVEGD